MNGRKPVVISIVGRSGNGKTMLVGRLSRVLKARGHRVGSLKHHAHPGIDIDQRGKDSWRHAQAGSDHVVIAAPEQIVSIRRINRDKPLRMVLRGFRDIDIMIADGYRREGCNRIENVRIALS